MASCTRWAGLSTDPVKQGLACGKSIRPTSENILYTSVVSTERISSGLVLPSTIQTRPSEKGLPPRPETSTAAPYILGGQTPL